MLLLEKRRDLWAMEDFIEKVVHEFFFVLDFLGFLDFLDETVVDFKLMGRLEKEKGKRCWYAAILV